MLTFAILGRICYDDYIHCSHDDYQNHDGLNGFRSSARWVDFWACWPLPARQKISILVFSEIKGKEKQDYVGSEALPASIKEKRAT